MVSKEVAIPCGVVLATYVFIGLWNRRRRLPTPPGPSRGEIDVKALRNEPWVIFQKWSQKYGPIVSWSIFGKTTVVIHSAKAVWDLLESRSALYSDRPVNWMGGEIAQRKLNVFSISSTNPRFKMYRRLMHGGLNPRVAKDYRPIQIEELHTFMKELERTPERFRQSIKRNACAIILKVAYGYPMGGYEDEFVRIIDAGFAATVELQAPGRFYVEFLPWLRFIPSWFPGAGFKRYGLQMRDELRLVDQKPFTWAQEQIATGNYIESFTSKQLQEDTPYIPDQEKEDIVRWVCAALYAGGADTTVSALTSFFYLMQAHPDVQKKAQQEIESVTSGHRLPTLDDYEALPYVRALIKEILRWGTVAPLGLPHCTTEDDIYEGYFIPKGSKVLANIWAIVHDSELYPDPFIFNPERHLGENPQPDPLKYIFGFGRRSCPGAHLAEMSLFLNMSNVLAAFDISNAKNEDGTVIEPPVEWTTGITRHIAPFPCDIKVRSEELLSTIS
ncbi:cytochrome P450 [Ephemerocybe angulata]|uniref:Cytochrome P450 n=1 Tax=Ephemerocybe angulata TaxID=980116 RepID=A0A8H6HM84_9AGAR|nr:cytochrome P450 [Tulosesus angulatus]